MSGYKHAIKPQQNYKKAHTVSNGFLKPLQETNDFTEDVARKPWSLMPGINRTLARERGTE